MALRIRKPTGVPVVFGEAPEALPSKGRDKGAGKSAKAPASKREAAPAPARIASKTRAAAAPGKRAARKAAAQTTKSKKPQKAGKVQKSPKEPRRAAQAAVAPAVTPRAPRQKRAAASLAAPEPGGRRASAETMATRQRDISVSEFFTKNRHLLGFDSPARALLTTVKEAVDNSLDAAEEAGILPSVRVELVEVSEDRYRVIVEDNGPGIVKAQVPKVFGKLLYGSKFHRLRQSLTGDQRLVVERHGRVERTSIGALVDELLLPGEQSRDVGRLGLRVPAFDPTSWRYAWRPVSHVIRHARDNEILEVQTECGKRVKVTGCHSLFTYHKDTRQVRSIEARSLQPGSYIVAPRQLGEPRRVDRVNLLAELTANDLDGWLYVFGVPFSLLRNLEDGAEVVHDKRSGRSRRYLRFIAINGEPVDVLDDSWFDYRARGFLPAWLAKKLGVEAACAAGTLRSYRHGELLETPVTWHLTPALMRLLGFFVAEGHSDRRQVGLTFGAHEQSFVQEVERSARQLGLSVSLEPRERNAFRVKLFGGMVDRLFPVWCGRGAKNKRVPWFVFQSGLRLRRDFLAGLYLGDGHRVKTRQCLMLKSASRELIADVETLWLLQGVVAQRRGPFQMQGLGRSPSSIWCLDVSGSDVPDSRFVPASARGSRNHYRLFPVPLLSLATTSAGKRTQPTPEALARTAGLGLGPAGASKSVSIVEAVELGRSYTISELAGLCTARVTRHLPEHMAALGYLRPHEDAYAATEKLGALREEMRAVGRFAASDLCLLRVRDVKKVEDEHEFVYDLSVPGCENFVAGEGPLACHNSRGQQGIGISAAGMYGQLTTGKPVVITSKTGKGRPAHHFEIVVDTTRNMPLVVKDEVVAWERDHGTRVEIELQGTYKGGRRSVDEYLEQVALANPHAEITYQPPKERAVVRYPRLTEALPPEPQEIQPHPYGVELGALQHILKDTVARTVSSALQTEFSRISANVAAEILRLAEVPAQRRPRELEPAQVERLHRAIPKVKIFAPPATCVVPIGEALIQRGLEREIRAEFACSSTRPPAVYRGNPFVVEAGLAYGGDLRQAIDDDGQVLVSAKAEDAQQGPITLLRLANRVPLQYQQSACAIFLAAVETNWRQYGLSQPKGGLPQGPMVLLVHVASVWVPFTSESKEAVAHYPEILKEIRLALQDCGRKLGGYLRRREHARREERRRGIFEMYIGELVESLGKLTRTDRKKLQAKLLELARQHTGDGGEEALAYVAPTRRVRRHDDEDDDEAAQMQLGLEEAP